MLTAEELRRRLRTGEDSYTKFKERIENPESIVGEIVAFANTQGGYPEPEFAILGEEFVVRLHSPA